MSNPNREWTLRAPCREADPELFMPPDAASGPGRMTDSQVDAALRYCAVCPVTAECDAYAASVADAPMVGVWGGRHFSQNQAEHRRMARKRANEGA